MSLCSVATGVRAWRHQDSPRLTEPPTPCNKIIQKKSTLNPVPSHWSTGQSRPWSKGQSRQINLVERTHDILRSRTNLVACRPTKLKQWSLTKIADKSILCFVKLALGLFPVALEENIAARRKLFFFESIVKPRGNNINLSPSLSK